MLKNLTQMFKLIANKAGGYRNKNYVLRRLQK